MKRLLPLVYLALSLTSWSQDATNEIAQPRPVYRYLFLVDTSSAMSRQKDLTMDTVSRLILSGIDGRIQTGEFWNIWTFDDQLHTNAFSPQMWDLGERADVADRAYRFLRDQRFNRKKGPLAKPLALIAEEAKLSGALTVFVFTDGSAPLQGTLSDERINDIFTQHAAGMSKAKKPFVVVLVAEDGQFTGEEVSPAGEPIYIPRPSKAVAAAKPSQETSRSASSPVNPGTKPQANTTDSTPVAAPPKKPLTVEEIAAALKQSQQKQTNKVAAASAPSIVPGTNSNLALPNQPDSLNVGPADITATPPAAQPAPPNTSSIPDAPVTRSNTAALDPPAEAAPVARAAPVRSAEIEPTPRTVPTPTGANVTPAPAKGQDVVAAQKVPRVDADAAPTSERGSPQSAIGLEPEPASNSGKYLGAAGALLLVAFALAWLYLRTIRYVPRPSLISRSMEKEKLKSE